MHQTLVRDVMSDTPLIVGPHMTIQRLAETLDEHRSDGAIVVDDAVVVGVVTSMDLVFQQKKVHLPTMLRIMEAVIPLGVKKSKEELERMTATTVGDLMSPDPITVRADSSLADAASTMVDEHISILPVTDESGALVGMLTRKNLVRWIAHGQRSSHVVKE